MEQIVPLDVQLEDFDDTRIHLSEDNNGNLSISLASPAIKAIKGHFKIASELATYMKHAGLDLASTAESEYDLTFTTNKGTLTGTK